MGRQRLRLRVLNRVEGQVLMEVRKEMIVVAVAMRGVRECRDCGRDNGYGWQGWFQSHLHLPTDNTTSLHEYLCTSVDSSPPQSVSSRVGSFCGQLGLEYTIRQSVLYPYSTTGCSIPHSSILR